jgi:hypothetical protein
LLDVNGDGLMDIATGWEQSGAVRAYLHPGRFTVTEHWPMINVGSANDVEDAIFVDLDADGAFDVVSCSEGATQAVHVHWSPPPGQDYMNSSLWVTATIPSTTARRWMYAVAEQVDGLNGVDLIVGGKGGLVAWLRAPASNPRNLSLWTLHTLSPVDWTMSLIASDVDNDGDRDVIVTDRFAGAGLEGARWLEHPGAGSPALTQPWTNHFIGAQGKEPALCDLFDLDHDGLQDLIVPTQTPDAISFLRRLHPSQNLWQEYVVSNPPNVGRTKAVSAGDVDLDEQTDLVVSYAGADAPLSGVVWLSYVNSPYDAVWTDHEISGPVGIKYDLVALNDLDGDGDLDVITTEENENDVGLGVIWYENPTLTPVIQPGDFDEDNDVDMDDYGSMQTCFTGDGYTQSAPACLPGRLDGDEDVDHNDLLLWQGCVSGAGIIADPECLAVVP